MKTYTITNEAKFNATVSRVYVDVKNSGKGDVTIITKAGKEKTFDGEHGDHDYEEDFGFVLVNQD